MTRDNTVRIARGREPVLAGARDTVPRTIGDDAAEWFVQRWLAGGGAARLMVRQAMADPSSVDGQHLARLQRSAGNQAVAALFGQPDGRAGRVVLRQGVAAASAGAPRPPAGHPGPTSRAGGGDDVEALLDEIAPRLARPAETPDFEAITGSTTAESSVGRLEEEIGRLWRRERLTFTAAARRAALTNAGGVRAPQSAETPSTHAFDQRWALALQAADYQTLPDIPYVRDLLRRGSPYGDAITAEFGNVVSVVDPTAAQITDNIASMVTRLALALRPGAVGQLLVTFSGHGANGIIAGVDGGWVRPEQLAERARAAAQLGVQIVYVMDTCRAGTLVQLAQRAAGRNLQASADGLPADRRARVQPLLDAAERVGEAIYDFGQAAVWLMEVARNLRRRRISAAEAAQGAGLSVDDQLRVAVTERTLTMLRDYRRLRAVMNRAALPPSAPNSDAVQAALDAMPFDLLEATSADPAVTARVLRESAIVLDETSNWQNALIGVIRREMTAAVDRPVTPAANGR